MKNTAKKIKQVLTAARTAKAKVAKHAASPKTPGRVPLVTWVTASKKKQIAGRARAKQFRSVGAFVRDAIEQQLDRTAAR